jgi:hypothetical protein
MASKRSVLALLSRAELLDVVDRFELSIQDRRKRDDVFETVAGSKRATLAAILPDLPRDRLKDLCRTLNLDDSGREKSALVDRLTGNGEASPEPKRVRANKSRAPSREKPAARSPSQMTVGRGGAKKTVRTTTERGTPARRRASGDA